MSNDASMMHTRLHSRRRSRQAGSAAHCRRSRQGASLSSSLRLARPRTVVGVVGVVAVVRVRAVRIVTEDPYELCSSTMVVAVAAVLLEYLVVLVDTAVAVGVNDIVAARRRHCRWRRRAVVHRCWRYWRCRWRWHRPAVQWRWRRWRRRAVARPHKTTQAYTILHKTTQDYTSPHKTT
jgi:hypothetical protein